MALTIITPHYNDFDGLKSVNECLLAQTNTDWEWIVVDDLSNSNILQEVKRWIASLDDGRVRFIFNSQKTNASVCRNKGAEAAQFDNLVFLDADDLIDKDFVKSRAIAFNEFAVFKNTAVIDKHGTQERRPNLRDSYLDYFLSAKFIWQTTAILWKKSFFNEIGKFDENLDRLQDVELSIRALFHGKHYKIIDNKVDFFYRAKPIRLQQGIVKKSCSSVIYLITKLDSNNILNKYQKLLIKSYYYACVKGLQRCRNREDVVYVRETLDVFYNKKFIDLYKYILGMILLGLYRYHFISDALFIKVNRYFFKQKRHSKKLKIRSV